MVEREVIAARLERLHEYLKILKAVHKFGIKRFTEDPFVHGAAERYLHLSIECLLDVGSHIISDGGYRKPETYSEIFEILAEERIISKNLKNELDGMAAFRNILVHDYLKLDLKKVYAVIGDKVRYFEKLAKVYAELL